MPGNTKFSCGVVVPTTTKCNNKAAARSPLLRLRLLLLLLLLHLLLLALPSLLLLPTAARPFCGQFLIALATNRMSHELPGGRDRSPSALTRLLANAASSASGESVAELRVKNMVWFPSRVCRRVFMIFGQVYGAAIQQLSERVSTLQWYVFFQLPGFCESSFRF